jgi:ABC-type multidrug transport system ATPase subunit
MLLVLIYFRYQAGEGIYSLFDKVLVLDSGRQVFFGPPDQARAYFEGLGYNALPRQSTADYLTGCTDPNERQFMSGRSHLDVPSTPEALETVFRTSRFHRDSTRDLQDVKARMQVEKADQEA